MNAPLWGGRARLVLGAGWSIGLLVVLFAWWGTSGEATSNAQYRWVGLGVAGMILCLAAGTAWLSAGMRAVGARIRVAVPVPSATPEVIRELRLLPDAPEPGSGSPVAAPGMRYYHRASCAMAQGKPVRPADRAEHLRAGRAACGVCRPDGVPAGVSAA